MEEALPMFALGIGTGFAAGAGLWAGIKAALRVAKAVVKRTPSKKDDEVVAKLDRIVSYLEEHPEHLDALHTAITHVMRGS